MAGPGWNVRMHAADKGKPALARAWDPNEKRYRSKRFDTEGQATAWAKEESARLRTGESQAGKAPISDIIDAYLLDLARVNASPVYIKEQKRVLLDAVAHQVTDLKHPRVEVNALAWLASARTVHKTRLDRPLTPRTRNRYLVTLRTLANYAVDHRRVKVNPFKAIKLERIPSKMKATFRVDEIGTLLDDANRAHSFYLLFAALIYTGCRSGEALHLRWEWIDWKAKRIVIKDWAGVPGAGARWSLKNKKERVIPLQDELAAILQSFQTDCAVIPLVGWIMPDALRNMGTKSFGDRLTDFCTKSKSKIECGERTPHSTRHTWIACMLATGENQMLVKAFAGHSALETTAGYAGTQELYRGITKDWPRGELTFRKAAPKLAVVEKSVEKSGD